MYSKEPRCIYRKNPLAEVICQLRFPEILSIETQLPDAFQDAIRNEFPRYLCRKENAGDKQTNNYNFGTQDGTYRVNLTSKFISLSCSRYTCWEDFAVMLDKPLAAFIRIYKPAFFERVGLRYVNFLSRKDLDLEDAAYSQLIQPCYLGVLGEEDVNETSTARSTVDADTALRGGCRVKLHAGPGRVNKAGRQDPEVKFVLDFDLYMPGNVQVNYSAGALQTLHDQSFGLFRGAITDMLHQAMEPMD